MDNGTRDYYDVSDDDLTILPSCPAPSSYRSGAPNSNGTGAVIGYAGSLDVGANDFVLSVVDASSNQPGLFFYGPAQI